jgi:hypothetical protein
MGVKKMANCEICDQELAEGEFEEKLGICPNCIMIECRADSYKSFLIMMALILGGLVFIVALFPVLFIVASLFGGFEDNFLYLIPPLTVCVIIGPGLIYLIFHKFR